MFDIGASELLLVVVVAIVVIGPKDLPLALRGAGRWIAKIRRVSSHFRTGLDAMIREAEIEEMEKAWRERNEAIMKAHPDTGAAGESPGADAAPPPGDQGATPDAPAASVTQSGSDGAQHQGH